MDHNGTPEQRRFVEKTVLMKDRTKLAEGIKAIVRRGSCVFEGVVRSEPPA